MSGTIQQTPCARRRRGLLLAVVGLMACATYSEKTQHARDAAQTGNLAASEKVLNKFLGVRRSADLPTEWKKETIVALLERAMVLHGKGDWKLSARDLVVADKQLVLLDVAPFGLEGSGGSTPLRITVEADPGHGEGESCVFGKLYAATLEYGNKLIVLDAQYKVIIVLAGLHNNLRSQTQIR